jgi:hypothetical protein
VRGGVIIHGKLPGRLLARYLSFTQIGEGDEIRPPSLVQPWTDEEADEEADEGVDEDEVDDELDEDEDEIFDEDLDEDFPDDELDENL